MPAQHADGDDRIVRAPALTTRDRVVLRGFRYYHFRSQIAYSQARPTQLRLPRETTRLDCSGLVAACMDFAGVMPKVDWRWTNTWTQIRLGKQVGLDAARPGDVVFYGRPGDPTHEALFLGTLRQLRATVTVPAEVASQFGTAGPYVLSNGHHPMGIYFVDYRSDRIQIRDLIGAK